MRLRWLLPLVAILGVSCGDVPSAPSPVTPPPSATTPAFVTISASPGLGVDGGRAGIAVKVQNASGNPLDGVAVHLIAAGGTLDASDLTTSSGLASTTLHADGGTTVTLSAQAGSITARTAVAIQPQTTLPTPAPTPPPTPTPDPGPISIALSVRTATTGSPTFFNAAVTNGVPPYKVHWTFGDGATFDGQSTGTGHVYTSPNTYAAAVNISDALGRSGSSPASVAISDPPPVPVPSPPPTPTPALTLTLTCTAATHGTPTPCNISAIDETGAIQTSTITSVTWDFGDGTAPAPGTVTNTHKYAQVGSYVVSVTASAPGPPVRTGQARKTVDVP